MIPPATRSHRLLLVLSLAAFPLPVYGDDLSGVAHLRQPIAVEFSESGRTLLVANAASGSVSLIDLAENRVTTESAVGKRLADVLAIDDQRFLLVDEAAHDVILIELDGRQLTATDRLPVSPYPVAIAFDEKSMRAYVTSLWSRRLTVIDVLSPGTKMSIRTVVDLDFPPRAMTLLAEQPKLVIADAFLGELTIYDTATDRVEISRPFFGHNVRSMAQSANGKMLLVGHQMLNELAHTIRNDVHWGLLMSNDLRWLRIDSLLDPNRVLYAGGHMHPVGEANDAAADPNGVAVAPDGTVVIALGGVNQIGVGRDTDHNLQRYRVGRRPTDVAIAPDGTTFAVANTFDDTITLFDLSERKETARIALGPQPTLTDVQRGEQLFYDGSLSLEGWMSCHSCHTDGHSGGLLNDNLSDGDFGAPKRVLSLLTAAQTAPYSWAGEVGSLHTQITRSITNTMQRPRPASREQIELLATYVASLELPQSVDVLRGTVDHEAIKRGREVFLSRNCHTCHAPPNYTTPASYDVGLDDKHGNRRFNPPSLRGLSHRRSFFHDSRAKTVVEVFTEHGHQIDDTMSDSDLESLVAFLRSL